MADTNEISTRSPSTWACLRGSAMSQQVLARFLYRAARAADRLSRTRAKRHISVTTSLERYSQWRSDELRRQLEDHFPVERLARRSVLDFGCGGGELCEILRDYDPERIVGVDQSNAAIARANARIGPSDAAMCSFIWNQGQDQFPISSSSVDLILCFDVLEHVSDLATAVTEWRRLLRPGGRVWIWWSPWRGPYGHHLESLLPLPWIHLLFSESAIFAACAARYDDPDFIPRHWDFDSATGRTKANKWHHTRSFSPFLNQLTRREFEHAVITAGLTIQRCEVHGFRGTGLRRATRLLIPLPGLGECFVSYYVYELTR